MDVWELVVSLRTELVDQLSQLPDDRWDTASLCTGWRVRDVVAHLILPDPEPMEGRVVDRARAGFGLARYIHLEVTKRGSMPIPDLIAAYREGVPRRTVPPGRSPEHVLAEVVVHAQDVRRPLGLSWAYDSEPITAVAGTVVADAILGAPERTAGLRLRANDLAWEHGDGDEVAGTAEALILAMAGRRSVLPELSGAGVEALASRR